MGAFTSHSRRYVKDSSIEKRTHTHTNTQKGAITVASMVTMHTF